MFQPIEPRESAVDACAGRLRAAILGGELQPGERLPPERSLTETFGVGRATVRGALQQLASSRLLSVRQGSGYVVRDFARDGGPDLVPTLLALAPLAADRQKLVADLLLVRRAIASAVLQRIVERHDPDAIAHIEASIDAFADRVAEGANATTIAAADLDIVAALLDATDSAVLRLCINPVVALLREVPTLRDFIYAAPADNLAGWRALLAVLRETNPDNMDARLHTVIAALADRDATSVARITDDATSVARITD